MRGIGLLLALLVASCGEPPAPKIDVLDARARATVPGQSATAVYFTLRNGGGGDALTGVAVDGAQASLHSSSSSDGVMRMRALQELPVAANSNVSLEPGGNHVMVTGLATALSKGQSLPVTLRFARSGQKRVEAQVVEDPSRSGGEK